MAVDVSKIPNNNKFDPVREAILSLKAEIEDTGAAIGNGTLTIGTSGSLSGSGTFTANQTSNTTITIGIDDSDYLSLSDTGEQTIAGDIVISGDLTISGTTTFIDTTNLNIGDNIITLNADLPSGTAPTENAGVAIYRGSSATVTFLWNETSDKWTLGSETLIAGTFEGNLTGDVTGNADTASALETARNIAVNGAVTGNADFDGSGDITITTAVAHDHDTRYYTKTTSDSRYVNVTGDTMTGNLNFSDSAEGITWAMNTDGASIKFYNTGDADTDSRLEFQTTDNNNEYFRWTHNPSGASVYELMRLTGNGSGGTLDIAGALDINGSTAINSSRQLDVTAATVKGLLNLTTAGAELQIGGVEVIDASRNITANSLTTDSISGGTINIDASTRLNLQYGGSTKAYVDSSGFNIIDAELDLSSVAGISLTDTSSSIDSYFHANVDYDAGLYTVTSNTRYGADYIQVDGLDSREDVSFTISPKDIGDPDPHAYLYIGGDNSITAPNTLVDWHTIEMNALLVKLNANLNIQTGGLLVGGVSVINSSRNITATSFIKSGGTSSQFLKADGSVDSNTYLTSFSETDTLQSVTNRGATTTNSITIGDGTADNSLVVKHSDNSSVDIRGYGILMSRAASYIRPTSDAAIDLYIGGAGNLTDWRYIYLKYDNTVIFNKNGTETFRVDGNTRIMSGNLQMGSTTVIDSSRNLTATSGVFQASGTGGSTTVSIRHAGTTGSGILDLQSASAPSVIQSDADLQLKVGGSALVHLDNADQYVGIGTTTPNAKLNIYANNTSVSPLLRIENDGDGDAALNFVSTGIAGWSMGLDNSDGDNFKISTDAGSISAATKLTINRSGNVGIGTTSPSGKLTVDIDSSGAVLDLKRDNGVNGRLYLTFGSAQSNFYSSGLYAFNVAGSEKMRITSAGNIGIGTTNPDVKFQVQGGAVKAATSDYAAPSTGGAISMFQDNNNYGTIWSVKDYNGAWGNIAISPLGGNVGIGTTSPAEKLDVNGSIKVGNLKIQNANGGRIGFNRNTATGAIYDNTYGAFQLQNNGSGYLELQSYNSAGTIQGQTVFTEAGNVGIGTTSPSAKLDIVTSAGTALEAITGDGSFSGYFLTPYDYVAKFESSDAAAAIVIEDNNSTSNYNRIGVTTNDMHFTTNNVERMRIDSSGRVGIGRTPVAAALEVEGQIRVTGTSGYTFHAGGDTDGGMFSTGDGTINFRTNGSERIRINSSGNVGIGTTSPSSKLQVEGDFNIANKYIYNQGNTSTSGAGVANGTSIEWKSGTTAINTAYNYRVRLTTSGTGTNSGSTYLVEYNPDTTTYNVRMVSRSGSNSNHPLLAMDGSTMVAYTNHASSYPIQYHVEAISVADNDGTLHNMGADYHWQRDVNNLYYIDGKVGIGTTSPGTYAKLDVVSSTQYDGIVFGNGTNNVGWISGTTATNDAGQLSLSSGGQQKIQLNAGTNNSYFNGGGNLGIGTTSPAHKLDVAGSINIDLGYAYKVNDLNLLYVSSTYTQIYNPENAVCLYLGDSADRSNYYDNDYHKFRNAGGTSALMYLNSTGLGIGLTSPAYKLDVNGDINTRSALLISSSMFVNTTRRSIFLNSFASGGGEGIFFRDGFTYNCSITAEDHSGSSADGICISGYDGVSFSTGSNSRNERMRISSNGNVGIGTTTPDTKLHIALNGGSAQLTLERTGSGAGKAVLAGAADGFIVYDDAYGTKMYVGTSGSYNGRVGIGTITPAEKLDVAGTIRSNAYEGKVKINSTATNGKQYEFISIDTGNLGLYDGTAYRLWVGGNGNIGIGTTTPSYKLEVNGNAQFQDYLRITNTAGAQRILFGNQDSNGVNNPSAIIAANGNTYIGGGNSWSGNGGTLDYTATFLDNGNVGIGTTSPSAKLDVNGNIAVNAGQRIQLSGATDSTHHIYHDASTDYDKVNYSTGFQLEKNTGTIHFTLRGSDGYCGIGDDTPSYKLDVDGTIRATGDVIAYSDARVKENVKTIDNALDKVTKLRGVEYNKIGETEQKIGVIAQEIEQILPQVVQEDENGMKSVAYGNIVGVLIEAIKEQQKQIDELKARLDGSTN